MDGCLYMMCFHIWKAYFISQILNFADNNLSGSQQVVDHVVMNKLDIEYQNAVKKSGVFEKRALDYSQQINAEIKNETIKEEEIERVSSINGVFAWKSGVPKWITDKLGLFCHLNGCTTYSEIEFASRQKEFKEFVAEQIDDVQTFNYICWLDQNGFRSYVYEKEMVKQIILNVCQIKEFEAMVRVNKKKGNKG